MSRGYSLDIPHEHARHHAQGDGPEIPRGSRGSSSDRPNGRAVADVRDALRQQLDIPLTEKREPVFVHDRSYPLRDSEVRTLATVGAFRIVDLRDIDSRNGDFAHLRNLKLIEVAGPLFRNGERATAVTLTKEGRELLRRYQRVHDNEARQEFYAGLAKPREALHDAQLYRAYADAAKRLQEGGARIRRVVLDYELKRDYQRFLQERNRGKRDSSGKPDRSPEEIRNWAAEHDLPADDGHVHFPDVRIEYERPDGGREHEDIELATEHYNSRQMAGKHASGFTLCRGASSHGRAGSPFDPHAAEGVLR